MSGGAQRHNPGAELAAKVAELQRVRDELADLPSRRAKRYAEMSADGRRLQFERWLASHRIADARISGVGDTLKYDLENSGIASAADVNRWSVERVRGFGPVRTDAVLIWRDGVASKFKFDASRSPDPRDVAALDAEISSRTAAAQQQLLSGPHELDSVVNRCEIAGAAAKRSADAALTEYVRATVDWERAYGGAIERVLWRVVLGATLVGSSIVLAT